MKSSISELQAFQAFEVLHSFLSHFQVECKGNPVTTFIFGTGEAQEQNKAEARQKTL
jgi:predicted metal-dependent peptidase